MGARRAKDSGGRPIRLAHGPVAQSVEQGTFNPKVAGSIPARPTSKALESRSAARRCKHLRAACSAPSLRDCSAARPKGVPSRDLRPEEQWARSVLQRELGCPVEQHDDGSRDRMYDLKVDSGPEKFESLPPAAGGGSLSARGSRSLLRSAYRNHGLRHRRRTCPCRPRRSASPIRSHRSGSRYLLCP
jgi:hypothetical protein